MFVKYLPIGVHPFLSINHIAATKVRKLSETSKEKCKKAEAASIQCSLRSTLSLPFKQPSARRLRLWLWLRQFSFSGGEARCDCQPLVLLSCFCQRECTLRSLIHFQSCNVLANLAVATKEINVGGTMGIKGDVNEDGTVNGTDIQEVINIIVNAE